jgi:hypothetical protein
MIVTTTPIIHGREIQEYLGIVTGEAILIFTSISCPPSLTLSVGDPLSTKKRYAKRESSH